MIRATKAAVCAGLQVARVQIDREGTINVIAATPDKLTKGDETSADLKDLI